jgi:hypothetical protein
MQLTPILICVLATSADDLSGVSISPSYALERASTRLYHVEGSCGIIMRRELELWGKKVTSVEPVGNEDSTLAPILLLGLFKAIS